VTADSSTSAYFTVVVVEVSGIKTSAALDQNNQGTGSSTDPDSGNITTTEDDEYLIGVFAQDTSNVTITEDSPWTLIFEEEQQSSDMPISVIERIVSSTLTESAGWTLSGSVAWWASVASFEADAGITPVDVFQDDANLVSLYLFENGSDLGEDSVGSNDLTNNNSVTQSSDEQEGDYSADFERSSSQYLNISDGSQSGLDITGSISLGAWIKPEALANGSTYSVVSKYRNTAGNRSYAIEVVGDGTDTGVVKCWLYGSSTSGVAVSTAASITAGTWYHVVAVYDGSDIRIYIDGALDSNGSNNPKTYSSGIDNGAADFMIGRQDSESFYFDGLVDEAFVFNDALSAGEVLGIYQSGIQPVGGAIPAIMHHRRQHGMS